MQPLLDMMTRQEHSVTLLIPSISGCGGQFYTKQP